MPKSIAGNRSSLFLAPSGTPCAASLCGDMERSGVAWGCSLCSQEIFAVPVMGHSHVLKVPSVKSLAEHSETRGSRNRKKRGESYSLTHSFISKGLTVAVTLGASEGLRM